MKRYRILNFFIDTSRDFFRQTCHSNIEAVKEEIKQSLVSRYGETDFEEKFLRYMELEKPVISIIAEHTQLLEDVCSAYICGNFYAALTGACCLGERIFNDILFKTMNSFKSSEHYKYIYGRGSVIDWEKAIEIMFDWKIIDKEIKETYDNLYKLRINSVHFQKKQQDFKVMSLSAINIINSIINKLFTIGPHLKNILLYFDVPGEIYIRKDVQNNPIVKGFFIPCSFLVGPRHKLVNGVNLLSFKVVDEEYEDKDIDDNEFVKLRIEFLNR